MFLVRLLLAAVTGSLLSAGFAEGAYADRVVQFTPGPGAGFGQDNFPQNVLGAPNGSGDPTNPATLPQDLLSLGDGGTIVLEFTNTWIVDGPGVDLTVFENPVQLMDDPTKSFAETATVAVSEDGVTWRTFPFNFFDPGPPAIPNLYNKSCYVGLAGVNPVLASRTGASALDPAVSGGDQFDLAQVGLTRARFVKITDTGTTSTSPTIAPSGSIVNDAGNSLPGVTAGFDLDAVAAIHTQPVSSDVRQWELYQ